VGNQEYASKGEYYRDFPYMERYYTEQNVRDYAELSEGKEVAMEATFSLERDLQHALRIPANIEELEAGLKITDGGREQTITAGRIDITAEDREGATVILELKAGEAGREAIGQILAYMGDLSRTKKAVRGILVARDFSYDAKAAARVVPNLRLKGTGSTSHSKTAKMKANDPGQAPREAQERHDVRGPKDVRYKANRPR
jgi:RecB family endonuclease NucS